MKIQDIISVIEKHAPKSLQESYDNSGLLLGDANTEVEGLLITIDVTEDIVEEAVKKGCNFIISHHPIIFGGIKSITGKNYVERVVIKAIKYNIAIYAAHTNLDSVYDGVSKMICDKIGLQNVKILDPRKELLKKVVVYCPVDYASKVRESMFNAGAGNIGNYDKCSFNAVGKGTFRAGEKTNPFVGEKNILHTEQEERIEMVFPDYCQGNIIRSIINNHPYEEVAYDIYSLDNVFDKVGFGMIGDLSKELAAEDFLFHVKENMKTGCIKYNAINNKTVRRVAVCGGSGSFLIKKALSANADVFITGDIKYHEFFDAEDKMIIADIGHYESEQFTKELLFRLISEKFPNFVPNLSEISTNPVKYI